MNKHAILASVRNFVPLILLLYIKEFPSAALVSIKKKYERYVIEISNFYVITEVTLCVKREITKIVIERGSTQNRLK